MNKALLELLETERDKVLYIRLCRENAADFRNQAKDQTEDLVRESCNNAALRYDQKAKKSEEELIEIRKEMKQYFSFLLELGV